MSTTMLEVGGVKTKRTIATAALDGGAGSGATGSIALFTVTGQVLILAIVGFCTENLVSAGGGTLALGVTGDTDLFIAATTGTDIDADDIWIDAGPDPNGIALPAACKDVIITDNIIGTVATADITDGTIEFYVLWVPLSANGNVS